MSPESATGFGTDLPQNETLKHVADLTDRDRCYSDMRQVWRTKVRCSGL